jgi:hypothetical protein
MGDDADEITISVLLGKDDRRREIVVRGAPDDDATLALSRAIDAELGWGRADLDNRPPNADDPSPFSLVGESPDDPTGGIPVEFIDLPWRTTFADMRLLVGPRPFSTTVYPNGFGGDGIEPFVIWAMNDLAPLGAKMVELYGYAELARRIGSASRRRRYREHRRAAELWIIEGGSVPDILRTKIVEQGYWYIDHLYTLFGLAPADAKRLMQQLNYRWDSKSRAFYKSPDPDAVN